MGPLGVIEVDPFADPSGGPALLRLLGLEVATVEAITGKGGDSVMAVEAGGSTAVAPTPSSR